MVIWPLWPLALGLPDRIRTLPLHLLLTDPCPSACSWLTHAPCSRRQEPGRYGRILQVGPDGDRLGGAFRLLGPRQTLERVQTHRGGPGQPEPGLRHQGAHRLPIRGAAVPQVSTEDGVLSALTLNEAADDDLAITWKCSFYLFWNCFEICFENVLKFVLKMFIFSFIFIRNHFGNIMNCNHSLVMKKYISI